MIAAAIRLADYIDRNVHAVTRDGRLCEIARAISDSPFHGPEEPRRRKPSVSADGTPVLLSYKADEMATTSFRLHAEPGAAGLTVSEQADLTLWTLGQLLQQLGWRKAAHPVNALVGELLPGGSQEIDRWWGGLGLGCASRGEDDVELRLYVNVREGEPNACWSRMGRALAVMWDLAGASETITALVGRLGSHALPVGVAAGIRDDGLAGLRLYFSVSDPSRETILASGLFSDRGAERVADFCDAYGECRPYSYGCVTLGFDFAARRPSVMPLRAKADFDCTPAAGLPCADPDYMRHWLAARHAADRLDARGLLATLDGIDDAFGGYTVDYVSVGNSPVRELTTYLIPAGFAAAASAREPS